MKRSLFLLSITLFIVPLSFSQVKVVKDSLLAPSIGDVSKFCAVLPDGYDRSTDRYPVVYLLHGFNGNERNWIELTGLLNYLRSYRFIVITPNDGNHWYTNSVVHPDSNFEDLIIRDLIPFVDAHYRTVAARNGRAVVGLSMGGYGAAKFGLKYPSLFFFAGCLSPAIQFPEGLLDSAIIARRSKASTESLRSMFGERRIDAWRANDVFSLAGTVASQSAPFFYIAVGSQDGIPEIVTLSHTFAGALRTHGILFEFHETPGKHEWPLWDREVKIVLQRIDDMLHQQR